MAPNFVIQWRKAARWSAWMASLCAPRRVMAMPGTGAKLGNAPCSATRTRSRHATHLRLLIAQMQIVWARKNVIPRARRAQYIAAQRSTRAPCNRRTKAVFLIHGATLRTCHAPRTAMPQRCSVRYLLHTTAGMVQILKSATIMTNVIRRTRDAQSRAFKERSLAPRVMMGTLGSTATGGKSALHNARMTRCSAGSQDHQAQREKTPTPV